MTRTRSFPDRAAGCEADSSASVVAELQRRVNAGTITPVEIAHLVTKANALRTKEKAQDAYSQHVAVAGARAARQRVARREARARHPSVASRGASGSGRGASVGRGQPQVQDAASAGTAPPAPGDAPSDSDEDDAHARRVGGAVRLRRVDLLALRVRHPHHIHHRAAGLPARRSQHRARRGAVPARATAREEAPAA